MRLFRSIRVRLTAWYLLVILVLLGLFGFVGYFTLSHQLYRSLDNSLVARETDLAATLQATGGRAIVVEQLNELVLIYSGSGVLLQHFGPDVELPAADSLVSSALAGQPVLGTITTDGGQPVRVYAAAIAIAPNLRLVLVIGRPLDSITSALGTFRGILAISGLAALLLAGLGGAFLATRVLRPVDRISKTAREIGAGDLGQRIAAGSDDELGRLAATLNEMIERLEAALKRQHQFTADASHELRTPLSLIQAEATLALSRQRSLAEYQQSLGLVSQESGYIASLIDRLLLLARADTGQLALRLEPVDLYQLLSGLAAEVSLLAEQKGLELKLETPTEKIVVMGDATSLRQLFFNILDNAIRYTSSGGVSVSLERKDGEAEVSIADTGAGISAEDLPHIFERFYRADKARSRDGGIGLGLAISREIALAHGGHIEVESAPGAGSTFRVFLPLYVEPPGESPK